MKVKVLGLLYVMYLLFFIGIFFYVVVRVHKQIEAKNLSLNQSIVDLNKQIIENGELMIKNGNDLISLTEWERKKGLITSKQAKEWEDELKKDNDKLKKSNNELKKADDELLNK